MEYVLKFPDHSLFKLRETASEITKLRLAVRKAESVIDSFLKDCKGMLSFGYLRLPSTAAVSLR
jgi:hypothetical protein